MAIVNFISIERKMQAALNSGVKQREIKSTLNQKAQTAAIEIAKELQSEFDSHIVTQELLNPVGNGSYIPGFPHGPVGGVYGNLVSFLGLNSSKVSKDLEILKALLTVFTVTIKKNANNSYEIKVSYTPIKKFYDATPPPEDAYSVSWLQGIETAAIQNFKQFLFRIKGLRNSRSGTGVQVQNVLRKGVQTMPKILYISSIYKTVLGTNGIAKSILRRAIGRK